MTKVELRKILSKLTHRYYIEITQLKKIINDICSEFLEDISNRNLKINEILKNHSLIKKEIKKIKEIKELLDKEKIDELKNKFLDDNTVQIEKKRIIIPNNKHKIDDLTGVAFIRKPNDDCENNHSEKGSINILQKKDYCITIKISKLYGDYTHYKSELSVRKLHLTSVLNMGLMYFITLFEAFNKDFFIELMINKPEIMRSGKMIRYDNIIIPGTKEDIYLILANKILEDLFRENVVELKKYLYDNFKIDIKNNFKNWEDLKENYNRRNVIVHHKGKISTNYIARMDLDPEKLGKDLIIDLEYLEKCYKNIRSYMEFIENIIYDKFTL